MRNLTLTIAIGLMLAGCNTVRRGTESTVTITAHPQTARIWTSLGHECPRSPCVLQIERKAEFTAYAEARAYEQGAVEVKTQVSSDAAPGVIGNAILPGGSVGLVVDVATGAMLDHSPNPAHIQLVPVRRGRRSGPAGS
ncbi:translation initiation factor 2 [Salinarimonas soli]|uniref:Translation initiation factor 2 n=1 Tax=Salinarimonas soli TaxID=1638099 RepID=A0A5B2VB05_9HYPH|nr:translation initiation factor 2 [Salinarimonas soli]KAA2235908.1 translation initiation factor 2 [Salinarimonas soli]